MMAHQNGNPAGLAGPRGVDAVFCADANHDIQTSHRPQLRRLGGTSTEVAFVEGPGGTDLGWLARGVGGWNGVRMGTGDALLFPNALKAARYVFGGRP